VLETLSRKKNLAKKSHLNEKCGEIKRKEYEGYEIGGKLGKS
jgi:hypothetical protein